MDDEVRKAVGLLRHQIISPVLMESGRAQMSYFRRVAKQEYEVPGVGRKAFAAETMKGWLKNYRKSGFKGITPRKRNDSGQQRGVAAAMAKLICEYREEHLHVSVAKFYKLCCAKKILGQPPICEQTMRRFLKTHNLFSKDEGPKARKRYEMDYFGELWVGDFMHGPKLESPKRAKAILFGIIDDHTRMLVGHRWSFGESTLPVEQVFKEALLKYGKVDRLYVDNGPSFSSDYLRSVCANLNIGLIHSKPYDSPSRGKIERFWRTVREKFLSDFKGTSLQELNDAFDLWLREDYHAIQHNGIGCRPLDRYQLSISEYPRTRINEESIEELFLVEVKRRVNKDATISFRNLIYELPPAYIGKQVQIRYRQENDRELFLYENDTRITAIKVVDVRANGKGYKPRARDTIISYQSEAK